MPAKIVALDESILWIWVGGIVALSTACLFSVWLIRRQLGTLPGIGVNLNGAFFFLGAGFMLIETKGITRLPVDVFYGRATKPG